MNVEKILIIEGITDVILLGIKFTEGLITNSSAIISDALHSLTDLANNVIALIAIHSSEQPRNQATTTITTGIVNSNIWPSSVWRYCSLWLP